MKKRHVLVRRQYGFSLVEAAVVLVVISIILGAVLQGRSLIENAEYKSFRQELRKYAGAFDQFRDRFGALPGDFDEAQDRLGLDSDDEGLGDGVIGSDETCSGDTDESCLAWQHLRAAGLIDGNSETEGNEASPDHPYGGVVDSFFTGDAGNDLYGHKILVIGVPVRIAIRLDREEDNEICDSGRVSLRDNTNCVNGGDDWPAGETLVDVVYAL